MRRVSPGLHVWVQQRWGDGGAHHRITRVLAPQSNGRLIGGPFAGMRYVDTAVCSSHAPKVVGCYEQELHEIIEQIVATGYPTIIDIGSAEGYYAVGLAVRCPAARVIAFDIDENARQLCARLAEINGCTDRVSVRPGCDQDSLSSVPLAGSLIVCDCEGYEEDLLVPDRHPDLAKCDILVELHDFIRPGLTDRLVQRFAATHDIRIIDAQPRQAGTQPVLRSLKPHDQLAAMNEARPAPMQWAWMRTRTGR